MNTTRHASGHAENVGLLGQTDEDGLPLADEVEGADRYTRRLSLSFWHIN